MARHEMLKRQVILKFGKQKLSFLFTIHRHLTDPEDHDEYMYEVS